MKRLLAILLCMVAFIGSFAGCSDNANNVDKPDNTTPSTGETVDNDKTPITFTVFSKDLNPNYDNFESPVAKKIMEATGVTLKMEYPVGDLVEKVGLMIAGKSYPDMIFVSGELNKFVDADAVIDLEDMINEKGDNVKNLFGDYINRLRFTNDDPSIYMLGTYGVDEEVWEPSMGIEIQHAAVKEAGYPEIKTLEDAEKIIADYIAKHPTTDDGQPMLGLSLIADDWRWQSAVGNMAAFVSGMPDDGNFYIDPNKQEAVYRFTLDNHKDYFKWLNHMNDIGLLDKESFVQKHDHYAAKISSGRVVALNDQQWQFAEAETALEGAGQYDKTYGFYPAQLSEDIQSGNFIEKGYSGGWGISITDNCKDPDRAFQFLDWLCSDEAQVLNNWGIEGENYTIENGKRVISDEEWKKRTTDTEYGKKTGIGLYLYPFPMRGRGVLDPTGSPYVPVTVDSIIKNYNPAEKETLAAYGASMWKDLYPSAEDLGRVDPWGYAWLISLPADGELPVIITKLLDVTKQYIATSVMATPDEFDDIWDEFQAELKKAGVDKANEGFTKLLKDRIDLWN